MNPHDAAVSAVASRVGGRGWGGVLVGRAGGEIAAGVEAVPVAVPLVAVLLVHQAQPLLAGVLHGHRVGVLEDWPPETPRGQSVTLLAPALNNYKPVFQLVQEHGHHGGGGLQVVQDHLQHKTLPACKFQSVQLVPVNFPAIIKSRFQSGEFS